MKNEELRTIFFSFLHQLFFMAQFTSHVFYEKSAFCSKKEVCIKLTCKSSIGWNFYCSAEEHLFPRGGNIFPPHSSKQGNGLGGGDKVTNLYILQLSLSLFGRNGFPGSFPVLRGGHVCLFPEEPGEGGLLVESEFQANLLNGIVLSGIE